MRLRHGIAAVLLALTATVAAAAPASASTPACTFSATGGAGIPTSTLTSPGVYTGNIFFGVTPSCGTPYPALVHSEATLHLVVDGVARPDVTAIKDCSSPDPIMCLPFSVSALKGLRCTVSYTYELWVSRAGWYQPTAGSAKVTIAPVTGTHTTGTTYHPSVCG
jgi:hypothetical protein